MYWYLNTNSRRTKILVARIIGIITTNINTYDCNLFLLLLQKRSHNTRIFKIKIVKSKI